MISYVLDTDHLSLYQRAHPTVSDRVRHIRQSKQARLFTTIITVEEQCAGRLAQIRKAQTSQLRIDAYLRLKQTLALFSDLEILEYDIQAESYFDRFRQTGIRVGTQDLRIAAIALANGGILCTRNRRDFERIPGLLLEDWSM